MMAVNGWLKIIKPGGSMLAKINYFFFKPALNWFDLVVLLTVTQLIMHDSYWWGLAYLITIPISATMQVLTERNLNENSSNQ